VKCELRFGKSVKDTVWVGMVKFRTFTLKEGVAFVLRGYNSESVDHASTELSIVVRRPTAKANTMTTVITVLLTVDGVLLSDC